MTGSTQPGIKIRAIKAHPQVQLHVVSGFNVRRGDWSAELNIASWSRWRKTRRWSHMSWRQWAIGPIHVMQIRTWS
jgi:hypothetical protein